MANFWLKIKRETRRQGRPILALAPLAGISDSAFRQICKQQGADVVYSEMTSADALFYGAVPTLKMLNFSNKEQPLVVQLFGKNPEKFVKAAQMVEKAGVDGLDLNFGCPARKVVAHGGGVTLMRDLPLCYKIIKTTIESTKLPVSIKVRTSILAKDKKTVITFFDLWKKIKKLPLAAVMIHGRSFEQGFGGPADVAFLQEAVQKIKQTNKNIVVLVNGGIYTPQDAQNLIDKTKADGVGLARGILGRPWLFKQIKAYYQKGSYREPSLAQIKKISYEHARRLIKDKPQKGIFEVRKHLAWYIKGIPDASKYRSQLVECENLQQIKNILEKIVII